MQVSSPQTKGVSRCFHFRLTITTEQRQALDRQLKSAQQLGDLRLVKFILTIFAVVHYQETEQAACILQLSVAQVEAYVHKFLCYGVRGVAFKKSPGRRPKLSKEQRRQLSRQIDAGPEACGFSGACWRSPMVQQLIKDQFGVSYNVFYIAHLLKHLGFSYQKARFVADRERGIEGLRPSATRRRTQRPRVAKQRCGAEIFTILDEPPVDRQRGELSADDPLACKLLGRRKGETVVVRDTGIERLAYEIADVQSKYVHAFQETFLKFGTWFLEDESLHRMEFKGDDFSQMFMLLDRRYAHVSQVMSLYRENRLPLGLIARLIRGRRCFGSDDERVAQVCVASVRCDGAEVVVFRLHPRYLGLGQSAGEGARKIQKKSWCRIQAAAD